MKEIFSSVLFIIVLINASSGQNIIQDYITIHQAPSTMSTPTNKESDFYKGFQNHYLYFQGKLLSAKPESELINYYKDAIRFYNSALTFSPNIKYSSSVLHNLIYLKVLYGDYYGAMKDCGKYEQLYEDRIYPKLMKAFCLISLKRISEAKKNLEEILNKDKEISQVDITEYLNQTLNRESSFDELIGFAYYYSGIIEIHNKSDGCLLISSAYEKNEDLLEDCTTVMHKYCK